MAEFEPLFRSLYDSAKHYDGSGEAGQRRFRNRLKMHFRILGGYTPEQYERGIVDYLSGGSSNREFPIPGEIIERIDATRPRRRLERHDAKRTPEEAADWKKFLMDLEADLHRVGPLV